MPDISKLNFWSASNYMKRDSSTGVTELTVASLATGTADIEHHVGGTEVPQYQVSGEIDSQGRIWRRNRFYVGMENSATSPTWPELNAWVTTSILTISLYNPTGATVVVNCYYVVYQDYGKSG